MNSSMDSEEGRLQKKYVETSIDSGHDTMSSAMTSSVSRDHRLATPTQHLQPMQQLNEQALLNLSINSKGSTNGEALNSSRSNSQIFIHKPTKSLHSPPLSSRPQHQYRPAAYVDRSNCLADSAESGSIGFSDGCDQGASYTQRRNSISLETGAHTVSPRLYQQQQQQQQMQQVNNRPCHQVVHQHNSAASSQHHQNITSPTHVSQGHVKHHSHQHQRPSSPHQRPSSPHQRPSSPHQRPLSPQQRPASPRLYQQQLQFNEQQQQQFNDQQQQQQLQQQQQYAVNRESQDFGQRSPPIDSSRLRPIRQKTRNAIVNIQEDGWVCLEFLKNRRGDEHHKIYEVFRVSQNGHSIEAYQPVSASTTANGSPAAAASLIAGQTARRYDYESLPRKYWKKYEYAARFVNLVRSKTPKLTLYTGDAKCMLMENSPDADFEVNFYEGSKFSESKDFTRIIDADGTSKTIDLRRSDAFDRLDAQTQHLMSSVKDYRSQCDNIERTLTQAMTNQTGVPVSYFPITIGRRPSNFTLLSYTNPLATSTPETMKRHESRPPSPVITSANMQSFDGTLMSQITPPSSRLQSAMLDKVKAPGSTATPPILRASSTRRSIDHNNNGGGQQSSKLAPPPGVICRVFIPNIGWGSQMTNGEVLVQYTDGSELTISSDPMLVKYVAEDGRTSRYGDSEQLPSAIRKKLELLPSVMLKLENTCRQNQNN